MTPSSLPSKRSRQKHAREVIDVLRSIPLSRVEIAQQLKLSLGGVHKHLADLLGQEIIHTVGQGRMYAGRPIGVTYLVKATEEQIESFLAEILVSGPRGAPTPRPEPKCAPNTHRHLIRDDNEVSTHVPRERFRGQHIEVHEAFFGRALS